MARNSADEMLRWIPPYYSESPIYLEQNAAKGAEIDVAKEIVSELTVQFIPNLATWGLAFWESLCGITPASGETQDDRRKRVVTQLSTMASLTPESFLAQIKKATGETAEVYYTDWQVGDVSRGQNALVRIVDPSRKGDYILDLMISSPTEQFDFTRFKAAVEAIVPCHLAVAYSARLNHDMLRRYTHDEMKKWTHAQLASFVPLGAGKEAAY